IADRLEARRAFLNPNDRTKHGFRTLGVLLGKLQKEEISEDKKLWEIYTDIGKWQDSRNTGIHEIVKVREDAIDDNWSSRYDRLKDSAIVGRAIAQKISNVVQRLNKYLAE